MPSSRDSRKNTKHGKTASAAEWRLRAEMGAYVPPGQEYVPLEQRARMKQQREKLREAYARLPHKERVRQQDTYKHKLRALCTSPQAYRGAWDAKFAALLAPPPPKPRPRPPTATGGGGKGQPKTARPRSPISPPQPRASAHQTKARKDPQRAGRALDVKLRVARPTTDSEITLLAQQLNADRHFLDAFGGPVMEDQIRAGMQTLGSHASGTRRRSRTNKKR